MLIERKAKNAVNENSNFGPSNQSYINSFLERTVFYGLLLTISLTAIPYGTVDPSHKSLFVVLVCFLGALRVVQAVLSNTPLISNFLLFVPLLGVLSLAIVQTTSIIPRIFTLDSYETKNFILTFTGLLLTGETLLRYTTTQKRLCFLVLLVLSVGMLSALFGLSRQMFLDDTALLTYFFDEQVQYAQFVNRNHFAFLMEMTLGVLIGLFLKNGIRQRLQPLFWLMIATVCFTILSTNSRGGILSAVGLILSAFFIHVLTKKDSNFKFANEDASSASSQRFKVFFTAAALTCLLFAVSVFTVAFVGGDAVAGRLESIQTELQEQASPKIDRLDIWRSTLELIKEHPAAGVGFGAYARGITAYDKSANNFALEQAHNDYLELLANGGILAFLLMSVFLIMLIIRIREQFRSKNLFRRASCFGASIGILGVMLHSATDFGLHITINALIFIVLIVIAIARVNDSDKTMMLNDY